MQALQRLRRLGRIDHPDRLGRLRRLGPDLRSALRQGLPFGLLLALSVGLVVAVGAHLSNAFPSESRPFGWPGPATFENGVAMVRPELVLATSVPALFLGLRTLPSSLGSRADLLGSRGGIMVHKDRFDYARVLASVAAGVTLILLSILAALLVAVAVARASPPEAYFAFWVAHSLLALACFSIGFLARACTHRHATVAALGVWGSFAYLADNVVRWRLFRTEGYHNLTDAGLPGWFFLAQAMSPVSGYRATLILWRPGFRDYLEKAALDGATLPPWLSAPGIAAALLVLWVLLPLAVALLILRLRGSAPDPLSRATPDPPQAASLVHPVPVTGEATPQPHAMAAGAPPAMVLPTRAKAPTPTDWSATSRSRRRRAR